MPGPTCRYCNVALDATARFCPQCGKSTQPNTVAAAASRVICAVIVALELVAMGSMTWFVIPRIAASLHAYGGPRSLITATVFSSWWMPPFMMAVLVVGALAIFLAKTIPQRALLLIFALVIGVAPMAATLGGIYMVSFEEAAGALGAP